MASAAAPGAAPAGAPAGAPASSAESSRPRRRGRRRSIVEVIPPSPRSIARHALYRARSFTGDTGQEASLLETVHACDQDGDGWLTRAELRAFLLSTGWNGNESDISKLLRKLHIDRDDRVTIAESVACAGMLRSVWARRTRRLSKMRRSSGVKAIEIFLGGSCNPTTWRRDIAIPTLEAAGITSEYYYNPQVDDWTPDLVQKEAVAKAGADILFFVVDEQTRAIASMIEIAEHATTALAHGKYVVVTINNVPEGIEIAGEAIPPKQLKDLNRARRYLADVIERYPGVVLKVDSIEDGAAQCAEMHSDLSLGVSNPKLAKDAFSSGARNSISLRAIKNMDLTDLAAIAQAAAADRTSSPDHAAAADAASAAFTPTAPTAAATLRSPATGSPPPLPPRPPALRAASPMVASEARQSAALARRKGSPTCGGADTPRIVIKTDLSMADNPDGGVLDIITGREADSPKPKAEMPLFQAVHGESFNALFIEALKRCDTDGDGLLSASELKEFVRNIGWTGTDAEIETLLMTMDLDGDGQVTIEESIGCAEMLKMWWVAKAKPSRNARMIFLGGSCNPTTWRTDTAIPLFREAGMEEGMCVFLRLSICACASPNLPHPPPPPLLSSAQVVQPPGGELD